MAELRGWMGLVARLVPTRARERMFEPAVADLLAERRERGAREGGPIVVLRVLWLAVECRARSLADPGPGRSTGALVSAGGDSGGDGLLGSALQDVKITFRNMVRQPGFAGVTIVVLALGIGANVLFFGLLNAIVLRPLPFEEPERLYFVTESSQVDGAAVESNFTGATFLDWRAGAESLESMSAYFGAELAVISEGRATRVSGLWVSSDFFETLRVAPLVGRTFEGDPEAFTRGELLVSHGYWQRELGADPEVLGGELRVGERSWRIVGVLPADFAFLDTGSALFLPSDRDVPPAPIELGMPHHENRELGYFEAVARTHEGVTEAQLRDDLGAVHAGVAERFPEDAGERGVHLRSLHEYQVGEVRELLQALLVAVGVLLLVGTINVASLVLARTAGRREELAIRAALGASRPRLVLQLVVEGLTLALLGGAIGTGVAWLSMGAAGRLLPRGIPRTAELSIDLTVLGFTLLVSAAAGIGCALVPSIQLLRGNLDGALDGTRSAGEAPAARRARNVLVVAEIALSLVLVIGAGLAAKGFLRLIDQQAGFDPEGVLAVRLALPEDRYSDGTEIAAFQEEVLERLAALPGVDSAGLTLALPFTGSAARVGIFIDGQVVDEQAQSQRTIMQSASPDYFATMGIPLLRGRTFDAGDNADGEGVVIVSEEMVRRYFPDGLDPLEAGLHFGDGDVFRVVGVVGSVRHAGYGAGVEPEIYVPYQQLAWPYTALVVRTTGEPSALTGAVRDAIAAVDPLQTVADIEPMGAFMSSSVADRRWTAWVLFAFAATALVLSALGVFGVVNYTVGQRRGEIGIRMALGADRRSVLGLVVRQGAMLVAGGITIGLLGGWLLQRLVDIRFEQVELLDAQVIALAASALSAAALAACFVPARRATRVDPARVLRSD